MKIVVFLPHWIGDIVVGTPVYRTLREHFGRRTRMVGVLRRHQFDLLAGTDWFDELWPFRSRPTEEELTCSQLLSCLRRERFDIGILMNLSHRTRALAFFGGVRRRIGYLRGWGGIPANATVAEETPFGGMPIVGIPGSGILSDWMISDPVPQPKDVDGKLRSESLVDHYLRLAEYLIDGRRAVKMSAETGIVFFESDKKPQLATLPTDDEAAEGLLERWGIRRDGRIVFLHTNTFRGSARGWPEAYLAVLAQMIVDRLNHDVVILTGQGDHHVSHRIADSTRRDRIFSIHLHDLGPTKAILKRGRLLVATDSSMARLAQGVGLPLLGLYGPTSPARYANPAICEAVSSIDLDCLGCNQRDCPKKHHRCMRDLFPESLFYQIAEHLESSQRKAA